MTSIPSNTWFRCIVVLADGSSSSSAGVPNTVTVPGRLSFARNSAMATAAAMPIGPCEQCWSPWNAPLVPRSASYSTMTPMLRLAAVSALVACDERGVEAADAHFHAEVVLAQRLGELLDRPRLLVADLGVLADVVGERQELGLHQLLRAGCDRVASGAGRRQFRATNAGTSSARSSAPSSEHVLRRLALGRRLLRPRRRRQSQGHEHDRTRIASLSIASLVLRTLVLLNLRASNRLLSSAP